MRRLIAIVVVGLVLAGCKANGQNASRETSTGGISYIRIYNPGAKYISIRIAWPSDWANRADVNQAVPYIGADLILQGGADVYPAGQAAALFADIDAGARLTATPDNLQAWLGVSKDHLDQAVHIANAHLRAPLLASKWLTRIRDGFAARVAETRAKSVNKGFAAVRWAVFGDTPIRKTLSLDVPEEIRAVTRDDVLAWHRATLTRRGAKVVVVGELSAKEAGAAVDALLKGLPEGVPVAPLSKKADFTPRRILLHIPDAKTSMLAFIGPLPPTAKGGEFEDTILVNALGIGENSVLFKAVRTKLRATYNFDAGLSAYTRATRFLVLSGQVETGKLAQAEKVVRKAYSNFRKTGPTGTLSDIKAPFAAALKKVQNKSLNLSLSALMGELDGDKPNAALELENILDEVSEDSLKKRLQTSFPAPNQFIVLAVSPDANALPGACVITKPEQAKACE